LATSASVNFVHSENKMRGNEWIPPHFTGIDAIF